MIAKMKKLLLFVANSNATVDEELKELGRLGLVHIVPFQPPRDKSIELINSQIQDAEKALTILDQYPDNNAPVSLDFDSAEESEESFYIRQVLETEEKRVKLQQEQTNLQEELDWFSNWGEVSPSSFSELKERGVFLRLYQISAKELKTLKNREDIHIASQVDGSNQVILVTDKADVKLPYTEVPIPEMEKSEIDASLVHVDAELEKTGLLLSELTSKKELLREAHENWVGRLDLLQVQYGGVTVEGQVHYWKGFIPEEQMDTFIEGADKNHWGYLIEETTEEDAQDVPTLIHTSRWADRIRPVMSFMGLVPGYEELDVSRVFMIFFTFFTGVLVGDAGYGLIFLIITLLVHKKAKFVKKVEFQLLYTLSASILFWGILTGCYFGSETIAHIPFLADLQINKLASFGGNSLFIQKFMFFIGAIHLTIGHLQVGIRYLNSRKALAQLGWIAIIWGLFFLVDQMVLQVADPSFVLWLFVGGALLVALFSSPGTSFVKGILSSLGNLPLHIINGFSDIISYVRLYAVGLSAVLMASSFNHLAIGHGVTTVVANLGAVIILILGHGLNMILSAMAVLVHGVRLNMLEYAGHANVEFSGSEYNPFKLIK